MTPLHWTHIPRRFQLLKDMEGEGELIWLVFEFVRVRMRRRRRGSSERDLLNTHGGHATNIWPDAKRWLHQARGHDPG